MRVVLGNTRTCVTLSSDFVEACAQRETLQAMLEMLEVRPVASAIKAWKMHKHGQWSVHPDFAWWEAADVAIKCKNDELLHSLKDFVVRRHLNGNFNVRVVWTRMRYMLDGENKFARHHPEQYDNIDELTPIITNPDLTLFGQIVAHHYMVLLSGRAVSCRELAIQAARVNISIETVTTVQLRANEKTFVCTSPPHPTFGDTIKLLATKPNVYEPVPEWFAESLENEKNALDEIEDQLDRAIGLQRRLTESAETIIFELINFSAQENKAKKKVTEFMTTEIAKQNGRVAALQRAAEQQQTVVNCCQDLMDWYILEANEIKFFCNWKKSCLALETEVVTGGDS